MKNILILAGPSAVGKTTLAHALLKKDERFEFVRSVTTRAPRGDSFDEEYIYISNEEFGQLIADGGVLEYTEYAGNFYGTPRSEIERITEKGSVPLLILDLAGVKTLLSSDIAPNVCALGITAPLTVLEERLKARYGSDTEKLNSRLEQNKRDTEEIKKMSSCFFAFVENSGNVGKSVEEILGQFSKFEAVEPH